MSEGTRFRLPWAPRVAWLDQNPERVLVLLERLKDDPSTMVRRSVANNLNDLGRLRPELLIRTAGQWLEHASPERRSLVEHALRSAVKRSETDALALLGYGQTPHVALEAVEFTPRRVRIGGRVAMTFGLKSKSRGQQQLLVDVAVHFVKARGVGAPKVFKLGRITLAPRERIDLETTFSLAVHSTRVPRPGRHAVDAVVNGCAIRAGAFSVSKTWDWPFGAIAVPEIVPASSQNRASGANSSQVARSRKLLQRADLRGKTTMAEMLIGV